MNKTERACAHENVDDLSHQIEVLALKLQTLLHDTSQIQMESSDWSHVTPSIKSALRLSEEIDAKELERKTIEAELKNDKGGAT